MESVPAAIALLAEYVVPFSLAKEVGSINGIIALKLFTFSMARRVVKTTSRLMEIGHEMEAHGEAGS